MKVNEFIVVIACALLLVVSCGAPTSPPTVRAQIVVVDDATSAPLATDVYADGQIVASGVTSATVTLPVDQAVHLLAVKAPGFAPWSLGVRSGGQQNKILSVPVRLKRSP